MIGIIAAVSINGVIGIDNKLPFNYPEDMHHFKKMTADSVVIMGRKTFESIGKPLPKRENIVISSGEIINSGVSWYMSVRAALQQQSIILRDHSKNIWFIGGSSIYEEGMLYADEIHLTITPDYIKHTNPIRFPWINPIMFRLAYTTKIANSDVLWHACYVRNAESVLV